MVLNLGCALESPEGFGKLPVSGPISRTLMWGRTHVSGWSRVGFMLLLFKRVSDDSTRQPGLRTVEWWKEPGLWGQKLIVPLTAMSPQKRHSNPLVFNLLVCEMGKIYLHRVDGRIYIKWDEMILPKAQCLTYIKPSLMLCSSLFIHSKLSFFSCSIIYVFLVFIHLVLMIFASPTIILMEKRLNLCCRM